MLLPEPLLFVTILKLKTVLDGVVEFKNELLVLFAFVKFKNKALVLPFA
jgi:hypothetical protein